MHGREITFIQSKRDAITHQCPDFSEGLAESSSRLKYLWMITSLRNMWMAAIIHALIIQLISTGKGKSEIALALLRY